MRTAAADGYGGTARRVWALLCDRCSHFFPCLSDPGKRASWGPKVALVLLHVVYVGFLFLLDADLIRRTREKPWYTAIYLVLLAATLFQYFVTSYTSPGYVIDAMRANNVTQNTFRNSAIHEQPASRNENLGSSTIYSQFGRSDSQMTSSSPWLKLMMDLYPPGLSSRNWMCTYCNIIQPPRSKHCHDCDKCVLHFDHHCIWLGTCIGQGNHCQFWWYILEESILCIWTATLYINALQLKINNSWWKDAIGIILLVLLIFCLIFLFLLLLFHSYLVLTNQTTYELVRRRRILYLRGIPERVHPFSRGICRNLYAFCCSRDGIYTLEAVPSMEELEARATPYTCIDILSCRCCN